MNVSELLDFLFGGEPSGVLIYDNAEERSITDYTIPDDDEFFLAMPDAEVSLIADDLVYAVATNTLPVESASALVTNGVDETLQVYLLETPVPLDDVPEDWDVGLPIGVGWSWKVNSELMHELEDLTSFQSVEEEDQNDEPVSETPVETSVQTGDSADPVEAEKDVQTSGEETAPDLLNDAEILGTDHPDLADFYNQNMVFMTGNLYGQGDRRNTRDGDWKRTEMTLLQWMEGGDGWGLSRHPEAKSKVGMSIVPSENMDGQRKDAAIKTMYAVGVDIDSGTPLDDVVDRLEASGYFGIVYTTFNHRKTSMELKHDEVVRKMGLGDSPNRTQIQEYLRLHHKDRFRREFISDIEVVDARRHDADGLKIVLKTPPIDKFRVIFPLAEAVDLADLAPTMNGYKEKWADAVCGVAMNILESEFDSTSCDINRLFFTPRHAKGTEWYSAIVQGKPLAFDDIKPYSKAKYVAERKAAGDPFMAGDTGGVAGDVDRFDSPSGMNLNSWHSKFKERFNIADVLESYASDKIRTAGGERAGTVHVECPFEHEHSSTGGTATMAMNPDANKDGVWTMFCKHDACQGRHKLDFMRQMLEDQWFDEELLRKDSFMIPAADEDMPSEEEVAEKKPAVQEAEELDADVSEADIRKFFKRQQRMGIDKVERTLVIAVLAEKTPLGKADLNKIWNDLEKEKLQKERDRAAADPENFAGYPLVNIWDDKDVCEWGEGRIQAHNAEHPSLFHYIEGVARVTQNSKGQHGIRILEMPEFSSYLNKFTTWHHQTQVGDQIRVRGVLCPPPIVSYLYNDLDAVYPPLRGVTTSPSFTADGEMITERGYHSSGIYYAPDDVLDIPKVSDEPTEEEIKRAKKLLIEDTLADFPFAGRVRDEIIEECLDGDGIPAVTHALCMLLLFFCRDMIDGPTPGHLYGKPAPGTGASLLCDVLSLIGHGTVAPASALPTTPEEMNKTVTAYLVDGSPMILFDNINESVDSGVLASVLTTPTHKARILGRTATVEVDVRTIFAMTGNNVQLSSELLRRCILIDLDAQSADPEKRTGWHHQDIRNWVKQNRNDLVWACLTLVQNYVAKGQKRWTGDTLNSYENWSAVMGGIMRDAGIGGFLQNRDELKQMASDGKENDIVILLEEWWNAYTNEWIRTRPSTDAKGKENDSLIGLAVAHDLQLSVRKTQTAEGDPTYHATNFETFLTKYQNRVFALADDTEVRIEKSEKKDKYGHTWRLVVKAAEDG
jgi:hypothetical protein